MLVHHIELLLYCCTVYLNLFLGGPGLHDPCEKELADASKDMSTQEREDLTAAAQVHDNPLFNADKNLVELCCVTYIVRVMSTTL